ncbi:hypothetical protein Zmor_022270 [Zophobas morio]|uniref:CIDE-N domain-containing protein n=1 Tax=Zophobas morio TaxID=2755281 RepID=A0AA38HUZ9_9CUCU|nr:hypothetical protein Zmor_022270 [Zophobas morio]
MYASCLYCSVRNPLFTPFHAFSATIASKEVTRHAHRRPRNGKWEREIDTDIGLVALIFLSCLHLSAACNQENLSRARDVELVAYRAEMTSTKGFKVTDADRKSRVGIAAKTLDDLKRKTIEKFKLKLSPDEIFFQTQDGTLVENDEYFQTLHAQTLLVWVKKGETALTDAEMLYKTIREVNDEYLTAGEKVQEFFTEKMKSKVFKLAEVLRGIDGDKAKHSLKCDHPEWFEGLDTNAKTKEDYMFRRAQDRIRTYYYKSREELLKDASIPKQRLNDLVLELHNRLKLSKFNGCYFDRSDKKSLCDKGGEFTCQGRWDKEVCLYSPKHKINPYASREGRIVFQTWNLDHVVERSRSVLPEVGRALKEAERTITKGGGEAALDVKAIYSDLFTVGNLKFVHIVCHDKGAHSKKKAGPYLLY